MIRLEVRFFTANDALLFILKRIEFKAAKERRKTARGTEGFNNEK